MIWRCPYRNAFQVRAHDTGNPADSGIAPEIIHGHQSLLPAVSQGFQRDIQAGALAKLVHGAKMPTPEEEARDAVAADQCFRGCVRWLLGKTRETKDCPLVLSENMEYGFRRNLFGRKPLGLAIAIVSNCACLAKILINLISRHPGAVSSALEIACLAGCLGFVFAWTFAINEGWVWQGGMAYALRLLEAIDRLTEPAK